MIVDEPPKRSSSCSQWIRTFLGGSPVTLGNLPKITKKSLYGFDIFFDRSDPNVKHKWDVSLVFESINGADATAPGMGGVHVYSNSERRLTLANVGVPKWFVKLFHP